MCNPNNTNRLQRKLPAGVHSLRACSRSRSRCANWATFLAIAITAPGWLASSAHACGPFFPNDYFVVGGKDPLKAVELSFFHELSRTLQRDDPAFIAPDFDRDSLIPDGPWAATLDADAEDLAAALKSSADGGTDLVDKYRAMRQAMRAQAEKNRNEDRGSRAPYGRLSPIAAVVQEKELPITPLDMAPFEELLAKLPAEFALYARGAAAYYNGDMRKAVEQFNAVLALPEPQRKFRSTWAAFMIGKASLPVDAAQSIAFFQRTRQLAEQGLSDSLDLAKASEGWEARAHALAGEFVPALNGYAAMAASKDDAESYMGYVSLRSVCQAIFERGVIDSRLTEDAKSRAIVTAYVAANGDTVGDNSWLAAIERSTPGDGPVTDADRLAWIAYEKGDMDAAARWLKRADAKAPYAMWIQAKLLQRAGKLGEADSVLESLRHSLGPNDAWPMSDMDGGFPDTVPASQEVTGELGALKFAEGDYQKAFLLFLESDQWADAAYIGERVMKPDELGTAIAALDTPGEAVGQELAKSARHLYARRLARLNDWEKALPFYPDDELRAAAKETGAALARAREDNLAPRDRAQSRFDAAQLLREHGLDLVGAELTPDWYLEFGSFELDIARLTGPGDAVPLTKEERARTVESEIHPNKRYHYRYQAAELMWACAQDLPNNDALTAKSLYLGGTYLKNADPQAADRFYKALVRRNPNLAIARQADELRWFPPEFTDVVLYQHRSAHLSKRRVALAAGAGVGGVALLSIWWILQRRKKRPAVA